MRGPCLKAGILLLILLVALPTAAAQGALPDLALRFIESADGGATYRAAQVGVAPARGHVDVPVPEGSRVTAVIGSDEWFRLDATSVRVHVAAGEAYRVNVTAEASPARSFRIVLPGDANVTLEAWSIHDRGVRVEGAPAFELVGAQDERVRHASLLGDASAGHVLVVAFAAAPPEQPVEPGALRVLLTFALLGVLVSLLLERARPIAARSRGSSVREHLRELQGRLVRIVSALGIFALLYFSFGYATLRFAGLDIPYPTPTVADSFSALVFRAIASDLVPVGVALIVTSPVEAVFTQMQVSLFLAVVTALPLFAVEMTAFLAPALYPNERRVARLVAPVVVLLFLVGVSFAYFVMIPFTLTTLYAYAGALGAESLLVVDKLVSFTVLLLLVFGFAFETPAVMAGLAAAGVVSSRAFLSKWRYAVVIIFLLSALVSDPTVVSQILVAVPLCALYFGGAFAAKLFEKRDVERSAG